MREKDLISLYDKMKPEPEKLKVIMEQAEKEYSHQSRKKRLHMVVCQAASTAAVFAIIGICFLTIWITGNSHSLFQPSQSGEKEYATLSSCIEAVTSEVENKAEEFPEYLQESGMKVKIGESCYYISEQGILYEEKQEEVYELDWHVDEDTELLTLENSLYYSTNKDGITQLICFDTKQQTKKILIEMEAKSEKERTQIICPRGRLGKYLIFYYGFAGDTVMNNLYALDINSNELISLLPEGYYTTVILKGYGDKIVVFGSDYEISRSKLLVVTLPTAEVQILTDYCAASMLDNDILHYVYYEKQTGTKDGRIVSYNLKTDMVENEISAESTGYASWYEPRVSNCIVTKYYIGQSMYEKMWTPEGLIDLPCNTQAWRVNNQYFAVGENMIYRLIISANAYSLEALPIEGVYLLENDCRIKVQEDYVWIYRTYYDGTILYRDADVWDADVFWKVK